MVYNKLSGNDIISNRKIKLFIQDSEFAIQYFINTGTAVCSILQAQS